MIMSYFWIMWHIWTPLVFLTHLAFCSSLGLGKLSQLEFPQERAQADKDLMLNEDLEKGLCFWLRCENLSDEARSLCRDICALLISYSDREDTSEFLNDLNDGGNSEATGSANSWRESQELVEIPRQVDPLLACVESRCPNLRDRSQYLDCAIQRCVGKRSAEVRDLPIAQFDQAKPRLNNMDGLQQKFWNKLIKDSDETMPFLYKVKRYQDPRHSCLVKCGKSNPEHTAGFKTCLGGCI